MLEEINTNDSCNNKRYEKQECITDNDFFNVWYWETGKDSVVVVVVVVLNDLLPSMKNVFVYFILFIVNGKTLSKVSGGK